MISLSMMRRVAVTTGASRGTGDYLTLRADAEDKANELDQGLGHLAEAEGLVAESEERWAEAELHRVRGEFCAPVTTSPLPSAPFPKPSVLHNSKVRNTGSCAPRSVLPGSGAIRASVMLPTISSPRPTAGSLRASKRLSSRRPKRYSTRWCHEVLPPVS